MMKNIIKLIRPEQWLKNAFVFLPLFFGRHMMDVEYLIPSLLMFIAYSFAASGIYCFNDIYDIEADRLHPTKCKRPVASGAVSKVTAYSIMAVCFAISFTILTIENFEIGKGRFYLYGVILFYILMNLAYCVKLKQIAIVDVFIIAIGFVLRILAGGFATGIYLSHWIILMTFLLALFLAFAKRRDDVVMYEESGVEMRKNVSRYNLAFMNQVIAVIGSLTMMCYIMYTVSAETIERFQSPYIYVTAIFVLAGIIRYLQLTIVDVKSGSPTEVLMKDRFLQLCIIGWVLTFVLIIYVL